MLWILALSGIVLDLCFRFSVFGNQSININSISIYTFCLVKLCNYMDGRSNVIDGVGSDNTNETLLLSTEQSSYFDLSETSIMPFSTKDFSGFSNFYE